MIFKTLLLLSSIIFSVLIGAEEVTPMRQTGASLAGEYRLTVKQALTAQDDTLVLVKGYIISSKGDEEYWFEDATGRIEIEIDDRLFTQGSIKAYMLVTIVGEIEKEWKDISIEVEQLLIH